MSALQSTWNLNRADLVRRAGDLAGQRLDQDAIVEILQCEFPGLPAEQYYANPAAIAVMARLKRGGRAAPAAVAATKRGEPAEEELAGISNGRELLTLCQRYGIRLGWDESAQDLAFSRQIARGGPLYRTVQRYRASLVKLIG